MQTLAITHRQQQMEEWDGASLFVENTICANTRRDYAAEIRLLARFLDKSLQLVNLGDLLSYRQHLEDSGLKPATIAKKLAVIRRLYGFLHEQGFLPRNPAAGLKLPKVNDESGRDILTLEECNRLLASVDAGTVRGLRNLCILALMLQNGLRCCEIVRANVGDLRQEDGYWVLRVHSKGGKEADTRIRDDAMTIIERYLQTRGEVQPEEPLFIGTNHRSGSRMTTRTVQHMVNRCFEKAGITRPNVVVHSLRHSSITHVILAGASILSAQEFARHQNVQTTTRYYHNLEKMKNHAVMLSPIRIASQPCV